MLNEIPNFLYELLIKQYGEKLTNSIIEGYSTKRPLTIRINKIKTDCDKIKDILNANNIKYKEVSFYKDALIIENYNKKDFENLDIYENGEIYFQSLSSMLPPIILNPKEGENILDMAAAPGGKTTQMAAISENKALITACEKNKIRSERLKYNVKKQGANVNILVEDARKLNDYFIFDKILLDAPCSGSGTINLDDKNFNKFFTQDLVNRSVKVQQELLKKALKIVRAGSEIVYSTCSILKKENEDNLQKLINDKKIEIIPINQDILDNLPLLPVSIKGTMCVCPNELYEGFFVAKIRKI